MITKYIQGIQKIIRDTFKSLIKENIAIFVVIANTFFVAVAQNDCLAKSVSIVNVIQIIINSLIYLVWVDFNFKLSFKSLLAGGITHIIAVETIALWMKYFGSMSKRCELPIYINGYLNKVVVLVIFIMAIYWIFTGNDNSINKEKNNKSKDKDFYG